MPVKVTEHGTIRNVRHGSILCNSNFVFKMRRFSPDIRLGLGVRQGHWKCHHAIERIRLRIGVL